MSMMEIPQVDPDEFISPAIVELPPRRGTWVPASSSAGQQLLFIDVNEPSRNRIPGNQKAVRSHAMKHSWRSRKQTKPAKNSTILKAKVDPPAKIQTFPDHCPCGSHIDYASPARYMTYAQSVVEQPFSNIYAPSHSSQFVGTSSSGGRLYIPTVSEIQGGHRASHPCELCGKRLPPTMASDSLSRAAASDPFNSYPIPGHSYVEECIHHCELLSLAPRRAHLTLRSQSSRGTYSASCPS